MLYVFTNLWMSFKCLLIIFPKTNPTLFKITIKIITINLSEIFALYWSYIIHKANVVSLPFRNLLVSLLIKYLFFLLLTIFLKFWLIEDRSIKSAWSGIVISSVDSIIIISILFTSLNRLFIPLLRLVISALFLHSKLMRIIFFSWFLYIFTVLHMLLNLTNKEISATLNTFLHIKVQTLIFLATLLYLRYLNSTF